MALPPDTRSRAPQIAGGKPAGAKNSALSSHQLPADLEGRAAERLGLTAALIASVAFVEAVFSHSYSYLAKEGYPEPHDTWDLLGVALTVTVSMMAFAAMRAKRWPVSTRVRLGIVYLIGIAYLVSLVDHVDHFWRDGHSLHGIPWVVVLLVIFPVVVPMRAMHALWIALAMAVTGPLALYTLSWTLGYATPNTTALLESCPFVVAPLAAAIARIVHSMGIELKHARRLGQYELDRRLGEGGMGVVYLARHAMMRRPTAVKLLPPEKAGAASILRFEREVQLTAQLTHPHTITIYDYGRTADGTFYYAMELLDGATLAELVEATGPLPAGRVIRVLHQVAGALSEAHEIDLIHRDVKPANIMLVYQGGRPDQAKVLDFGLVKQLDSVDPGAVTHADAITGTPQYIAPEAITNPNNVDARADIYALGAVGYFLLTGQHVFSGSSVVEICARHLSDSPIPPSVRLERPVPADLEQLILACLAKARSDRPQTTRALQDRLQSLEDFDTWSDQEAQAWWARYRATRAPSGVKPNPPMSDTLLAQEPLMRMVDRG